MGAISITQVEHREGGDVNLGHHWGRSGGSGCHILPACVKLHQCWKH